MDVKPALTPKEWMLGEIREEDWIWFESGGRLVYDTGYGQTNDIHNRHAVAAMCLYDQPFGFTWDDVDLLRSLLLEIDFDAPGYYTDDKDIEIGRANNVVDRIAALLPPRDDAP